MTGGAPKMGSTKKRIGGAAVAVVIATGLIAGFEGYRNHVYPDPATNGAPWTYCYGETENPQFGHTYTREECDALLQDRVAEFNAAVRSCIHVAMPPKTEAAFTSTAYNIGKGAFCRSTIVRLANAGDLRGACNQLPRWNRAGGKVLRGLTVRRGEEQALCLEGLAE